MAENKDLEGYKISTMEDEEDYFDNVEILGQKMENANQLRMVVELSNELHFTGNTADDK